MAQHRPRGFTFVTLLLLLALGGGAYWLVSYGPAYWDNLEVKSVLRQAGNMCYGNHDDGSIRRFIYRKLDDLFGYDANDNGELKRELSIDLNDDDLQIQRTQVPPQVDIWLSYSRTIKLPFVDEPRTLKFTDHVQQDLSDIKW